MKLKWIICTLIVVSLYGCTETVQTQHAIDELRYKITDLKNAQEKTTLKLKELEDTNSILSEQNKKLVLLKKKLSLNTENIKELRNSAFEIKPPSNLKVIKLKQSPVASKKSRINISRVRKYTSKTKSHRTKPPAKAVKKRVALNKTVTVSAQKLYQQGLDYYYAGDHQKARDTFKILLINFPKHDLADNALYWTGETYFDVEEFPRAIKEFTEVVKRYPNGNKTPDALLKAGFSFIELDKPDNAKKILSKLINLYPDSEATSKARQRIKELERNQ